MNDIVAEFRAGLLQGVLLLQRCRGCSHLQMYPRYRCTKCQSDQLGFTAASGAGILHSYTVIRAVPPRGFEDDVPYALGVVKLPEGVQLLGRLAAHPESREWSHYRCDGPVVFCPADAEEVQRRPVAWFTVPTDVQVV
jgi:uncharacterized OB-fold protein